MNLTQDLGMTLVAALRTPTGRSGHLHAEELNRPHIYYKMAYKNLHYFQYSIQKRETNKVEQAGYGEADCT